MEIFILYLILQLDSFSNFLFLCTVVSVIAAFFIGMILREASTKEEMEKPIKALKWCGVVWVLSVFVACLLPSTKSATVLAGAYAIKEVSKNETAQRLAGRSVKLIEDWLESLEPKKEKK